MAAMTEKDRRTLAQMFQCPERELPERVEQLYDVATTLLSRQDRMAALGAADLAVIGSLAVVLCKVPMNYTPPAPSAETSAPKSKGKGQGSTAA